MTKKRMMNISDWKLFKVIEIRGPEWNPFYGILLYLRNLTPDNHTYSNDILDEAILETFRPANRSANLILNVPIMFNGEIEGWLSKYQLPTSKKISIVFEPQLIADKGVPFAMGNSNQIHPIQPKMFTLRLTNLEDKKVDFSNIHYGENCKLPFDIFHDIIQTITPL